jgi:hypothetical protein
MGERVVERGGFKFVELKSGRLVGFWDLMGNAQSAHTDLGRAVTRLLKVIEDDWDLERLEWFVDHLATHVGAIRAEIEKRRGVKTQEERIALLRNTTGRTPAEAAQFLRKADELERKLREAS